MGVKDVGAQGLRLETAHFLTSGEKQQGTEGEGDEEDGR